MSRPYGLSGLQSSVPPVSPTIWFGRIMAFHVLAAALCGSAFADALGWGSLSSAGGQASSASYSQESSLGDMASGQSAGGAVTNTSGGGSGAAKNLVLSAAPSVVNEGGTSQLAGLAIMDDDSVSELSRADIAWSVIGGPVASIGVTGLLTAGAVYADSDVTVGAIWMGAASTTTLLVLNSDPDNYRTYAGDTIDDAWQVQYFGLDNPNAGPSVDVDGTGQPNLFKYVAGLNPIDRASRFVVNIQPAPGQPGQMQIVFTPLAAGRTYTVVTKTNLTDSNWVALTGSSQSDNGMQRTVTDLNSIGVRKFYRINISKP